MVTLVALIVVVVVLNRGLVWDAATIDLVVLVEALFIDVRAEVIASEFTGTVSCFVYVLSDMVVGALTGVMADAMMGFVTGIGVEMLADANVNVFAALMIALEFGLPKPLGEFSC